MYLNVLTSEEKVLFLDLAVYVSKSNGLIEESEQNIIDQYCKEMGIEDYDASTLHSMDEIINLFSASNDNSKRVAVLELLGLGYTDGSFDELENSIVKDFATSIGVSEETYNKLNRDIVEYTTLLGIIQDHVFD